MVVSNCSLGLVHVQVAWLICFYRLWVWMVLCVLLLVCWVRVQFPFVSMVSRNLLVMWIELLVF